MIKYNVQDLPHRIEALGLEKGDVLLVHNSLFNFGMPSDCKLSDVPSAMYSALKAAIGDEGTMAVPTFNFDFCKGLPFNKQESPSKNMGVFSEYVRKLPQSKRSGHAMQSIAVVGPAADCILENDTESSFSPHGPFDKLKALNAKIVLLGADINAVSMVHWIEEKYEVPYRYWKTFTGPYVDDATHTEKSYKMFVRSLETNPVLKLHPIERELAKANKIKEAKIGAGSIKVFSMGDFVSVTEKLISENPYSLVSNHPEGIKNDS